jgi:tRNA threonylcarbamoyladenosine biosynthesis protein TsaE
MHQGPFVQHYLNPGSVTEPFLFSFLLDPFFLLRYCNYMNFFSDSPEKTIALGKFIGTKLHPGDVVAMQGTLAAGKTTLTKGIALGLGITENVTSPTFTLISEYYGRLPLYHMDVYRLDSTEDFINLGTEEMLYGNGVCIIEWSEKVMSELPEETITIHLSTELDGHRIITILNWPYGDFPREYFGN